MLTKIQDKSPKGEQRFSRDQDTWHQRSTREHMSIEELRLKYCREDWGRTSREPPRASNGTAAWRAAASTPSSRLASMRTVR
jgi:hypothetical protein